MVETSQILVQRRSLFGACLTGGWHAAKAGDTPIGGQGSDGGKPTWAQVGIAEVELGGLNVIRGPDLCSGALAEVIATFEPAMEYYHEMTAAESADEAEKTGTT